METEPTTQTVHRTAANIRRGLGLLSLAVLLAAPADAQTCKVLLPIGNGDDIGTAVAVQSDGKIVLAGRALIATTDDFAVARFNSDFTLDRNFGVDGIVTTAIGSGEDRAEAIAIQSDGKILVGGHSNGGATNDDFALVRYNTDGSLDTSFGGGSGIVTTSISAGNDEIEGIAIQGDGNIIVVGWATPATQDFVIARYTVNGTLDGSYATGGVYVNPAGPTADAATAVALQADGKAVLAGWANNGANDDFAAVRFTTTGAVDWGPNLYTPGPAWDRARAVAIQGDGKIVIAGESRNPGTNGRFAVIRLLTTGALDTAGPPLPAFNAGVGMVITDLTGNHDEPYGVVVQADGRIVAGGFANWPGFGTTVDQALARYDTNGGLDGTFGGGGTVTYDAFGNNDFVDSLALQTDQKILLGGYSNNGTNNDFALVRYKTDGSVDDTCRPAEHYRSIGSLGAGVYGGVTATTGSAVVTGGATTWLTDNRGRGDRITIDAKDYTILTVDSDTQLRLTAPFNGVTGTGKSVTIARKFATLAAWEDCIDGPGGAGCEGVASASLVADQRREYGIAYKDGPLALVTIDGTTTDASHAITLTADGVNRHYGLPGTGVIVNSGATAAVRVRDDYTIVEWLEVTGGAQEGIEIELLSASNKHIVRNNLVHGLALQGILIDDPLAIVDLYNNIVYSTTVGIRINQTLSTGVVRAWNNTCYNNSSGGITASGSNPSLTLINNIAHSNGTDYSAAGLTVASHHNLSSDDPGLGHSPGGGGVDEPVLANMNFVSAGTGNLHITTGSSAENVGADLSGNFPNDIDGGTRKTLWDMGADDIAAAAAVELVSFSASGVEAAVELEWETGSELDNLGFHLYRSLAEEGPWERITASLIPGLGSSPMGARYSYRDAGLVEGVRYYYELEDVETTGATERHGPVSAVPGAAPGDGDGDEAPPPPSPARLVYGDPEANAVRVVQRGRRALVEVVTEGFYALPQPDGTVRLEIPDFELAGEAGDPAVPIRRAWVQALAGRTVELGRVRATGIEGFTGLRPAHAGAAQLEAHADGTLRAGERRARRAYRRSGDLYPSRSARILEVGFQAEIKKALLELAPLRWDEASGQLLLARRLQVEVSFRGRDRSETSRGGARGRRRPRARTPEPGAVLVRLATREAGLHGVAFEELFPGRRRGWRASELRLSRQGEAVAFHVEPDPQRLEPGSRLYFLSEGGRSNPYANEAVYELEQAEGGIAMESGSAAPRGPGLGSAQHRLEWEESRYYMAALLEAPDLWLWDRLFDGQSRSFTFDLTALAPGGEAGRLELHLQGGSDLDADPDHHVRVSVNGLFVADARWDGQQPYTLEAALPPGALVAGPNQLELVNVGDTGAAYSVVYLDRFAVEFPRRLEAEGGLFAGRFSRSGAAEVSGLDARAALVETGAAVPRWLSGAASTGAGLRFRVEAERGYLATAPEALPPVEVRPAAPSRLRDSRQQADYLLVGPRAFLAEAEPLLRLRRDQGLHARGVAIEEIFDEFGHGEPRPEALREFLAWTYHEWTPPSPRYVVLLGDASFDPKDLAGTGVPNPVPTVMFRSSYLWTASDPAFAAVNGEDALPDLALGRLPASSPAEARALVEKILAWESDVGGVEGPVALVADDPDAGGDFEADAERVAGMLPAGREVERLYVSRLGGATRAAIHATFDRGASLVSYLGHGSLSMWASENVFNRGDVPLLQPQPRQPVVLTMNCLNGYFVPPATDALGEELILAPGRGAIAVFSPSGLSLHGAARRYHEALVHALVSGGHERLGDAVLEAQAVYAESGALPELLRLYHLFGDPALRLRRASSP